jgi:hypothetical protein
MIKTTASMDDTVIIRAPGGAEIKWRTRRMVSLGADAEFAPKIADSAPSAVTRAPHRTGALAHGLADLLAYQAGSRAQSRRTETAQGAQHLFDAVCDSRRSSAAAASSPRRRLGVHAAG